MKKEKIYNFSVVILIFLIILSSIISKPLNDLDEIWNYNFARNIANGLIPYKDFNMVITPLLSILCGTILKLLCDELIIMRIIATVLHTLIWYIVYKICNLLNIKKVISIIFTIIIGCLFYNSFCIDYNYTSLLVCLYIIYIEIKEYKENNIFIKQNHKNDLILGLLAGAAISIKQTTGIFICIALLGNKLLFVRGKDEFKIYLKSFAYRLIGILIPIISIIIYLLINNALGDFISYTITGVSGFSNYIPYTHLINFNVVGILSILVPITFVYEWIKTICCEKGKIEYIFLVYGLAMFVVCFPISDKIHFLIGGLPTIILILYEIYILCSKIIKRFIILEDLNFIIKLFEGICIIVLCSIMVSSGLNYFKTIKNNSYSTLKHYKFVPIDTNLEQQITKINKYIESKDKDIKILDAAAAIYMIPLNKYNKDYDMFNKGNFGEDGEERLIKEISNSQNTQYLILKDKYTKNWQIPLDIIRFVEKNKTKVGEIEIFDIYE